jgi:hypothetical protein
MLPRGPRDAALTKERSRPRSIGGGHFCFGYWNARFSEWAALGPLLLRTQLIVLHGVRSTSFVGALGPRFSANADSKPPTQRAAMAQQIRLSAPRNISSLKLRDQPALNIVFPSNSIYLQKSLNRSCDLIPPEAAFYRAALIATGNRATLPAPAHVFGQPRAGLRQPVPGRPGRPPLKIGRP